MDRLIVKTDTVKQGLLECRLKLSTCKEDGKRDVRNKLVGMHETLHLVNDRLQQVTLEAQRLISASDDELREGDADLKPEICSIHTSVTAALVDLETASDKAIQAMELVMVYRTNVGDINQDINIHQRDVLEAYEDVIALSENVNQELLESKRQVEKARDEVQERNKEIERHATVIRELRSGIASKEKEVAGWNENIANARREAAEKEEKAWMGFGTAMLGVVLAVPTFGVSSVLIGAGGAYAAGNISDYKRLQAHVKSLNDEITGMKTKIAFEERQESELNIRKVQSQARLLSLECTLAQLVSNESRQQQEAIRVRGAQSDVSGLCGQAKLLLLDVEALEHDLQHVKETLSECTVALSQESAQLEIENSLMDRPQLRKANRERDFRRNRATLLRVLTAVDKTRAKMPQLLAGSESGLLEQPCTDSSGEGSTSGVSLFWIFLLWLLFDMAYTS
ncbi:hypothetical protein FB567DRAFT_591616 [Paraphoma chrysanthemicola]|uniref:Uncharacterized protein n=1 Tax=Paraphoma chrysanthemicola TaxID=798071 RepID=A0A8K0R9J1_9PLEO|nr:hypothetical protein FB567DRAFT_591616 [Paraphoma chrysanthemicola]